jgi:hypothetical protein
MGDKEHKQPLAADLPALTERRVELERKMEDCEAYLRTMASFTSSEKQFRTHRDIEDYEEELAALHEAIASKTSEARTS